MHFCSLMGMLTGRNTWHTYERLYHVSDIIDLWISAPMFQFLFSERGSVFLPFSLLLTGGERIFSWLPTGYDRKSQGCLWELSTTREEMWWCWARVFPASHGHFSYQCVDHMCLDRQGLELQLGVINTKFACCWCGLGYMFWLLHPLERCQKSHYSDSTKPERVNRQKSVEHCCRTSAPFFTSCFLQQLSSDSLRLIAPLLITCFIC